MVDGQHGGAPAIGIVGFGAFGRLMARHLAPHFPLFAYDPVPPLEDDPAGGLAAMTNIAAVARCPIVVLALPVDRLADAVAAIGPHLQPGALVMDVASVKIGPSAIMLEGLPPDVDVIGTHPLFGPQSAAQGIAGLKIAVCPIRGDRERRVAAFLRRTLQLRVYLTTPEAHDREAATVQGLTHLIAKVLIRMEPLPHRMTTASFDMLMRAVEMVRYDAPEVFLAIERANPFSTEVRERFFGYANELRASLEHPES